MKLLLDSHVPADVATAVLKLQSSWSVEQISSWQGGVWRNQGCIKLPIPTKCGRDVSPKRPCLHECGRLGEASLPNKRV